MICPQCGQRVLASPGEHCPKCFHSIPPSQSSDVSSNSVTKGRVTFRSMIARRAIGGIFLGLILAFYGMFGGSYQRRGVGYVASGSELIGVGVGIAIFGAIVYLVFRPRK